MSSIVNFHAFRLKDFKKETYNREAQYLRPRAQTALKQLPFVGLVEDFDKSMERYAELVRPYFPDFELIEARANTNSNPGQSLKDRLAKFEAAIGKGTYINLTQLNAIDMELYYFVREKLWGMG